MADAIGYTADPTTPDQQTVHRASLVLAGHATDTTELLQWLDMLGLPPCERDLHGTWKGNRYERR